MYAHLARYAGEVCLRKGRRIHTRLEADPRLGDAAAELAAAQDALETKLNLWQNAVEAARTAQAIRDEAYRALQDRLREFGLNVLSVTRNHHDDDSFLRYFPDGYGPAIHEKPPELSVFAAIVLGKLDEETDPWLVCFRGRLTTALDRFAIAQRAYTAAAGAQKEAFAYLVAERRRWIQGLSRSRLKAQAACLSDWPYLQAIFSPAAQSRRSGAVEETEAMELSGTPENQRILEIPAVVRLRPGLDKRSPMEAAAVAFTEAIAGWDADLAPEDEVVWERSG